jgi:hypothetical protein
MDSQDPSGKEYGASSAAHHALASGMAAYDALADPRSDWAVSYGAGPTGIPLGEFPSYNQPFYESYPPFSAPIIPQAALDASSSTTFTNEGAPNYA